MTAVEIGLRKQMINSEREMINSTGSTHFCVLLHSKNCKLIRFSYSRHPKFLQKPRNERMGPKYILTAH